MCNVKVLLMLTCLVRPHLSSQFIIVGSFLFDISGWFEDSLRKSTQQIDWYFYWLRDRLLEVTIISAHVSLFLFLWGERALHAVFQKKVTSPIVEVWDMNRAKVYYNTKLTEWWKSQFKWTRCIPLCYCQRKKSTQCSQPASFLLFTYRCYHQELISQTRNNSKQQLIPAL